MIPVEDSLTRFPSLDMTRLNYDLTGVKMLDYVFKIFSKR